MDVEQPIPNTPTPERSEFDPEHPYEDGPDWGIEEAAHDAAMAGAHYNVLRDLGIPAKRAHKLTLAWMELHADE